MIYFDLRCRFVPLGRLVDRIVEVRSTGHRQSCDHRYRFLYQPNNSLNEGQRLIAKTFKKYFILQFQLLLLQLCSVVFKPFSGRVDRASVA